MDDFSDIEIKIFKEISSIYNSGDILRALERSKDFLNEYPSSPLARYKVAVLHGDYSDSVELESHEKEQLKKIAKSGIRELFNELSSTNWPERFKVSVKNEYYWFFEMPEEQYKLGIEQIQKGQKGEYSACVGASMIALKELKLGNDTKAEKMARISLDFFKKFEEYSPNWFNINFFAAQAEAVLGRYENSMTTISKMFEKQGKPEDPAYIKDFKEKVEVIKTYKK